MVIFYTLYVIGTILRYWQEVMGVFFILCSLFATVSSIKTYKLYRLIEEYRERELRYDG